jgi:hypothetical protein
LTSLSFSHPLDFLYLGLFSLTYSAFAPQKAPRRTNDPMLARAALNQNGGCLWQAVARELLDDNVMEEWERKGRGWRDWRKWTSNKRSSVRFLSFLIWVLKMDQNRNNDVNGTSFCCADQEM